MVNTRSYDFKTQSMSSKKLALVGLSILLLVTVFVFGAEIKSSLLGKSTNKTDKAFQKYWYDGNAELASYKLTQSRYGELHEGHAVLIFVTEDFSKSKQVKLDNPQKAGKDAMPILKCNFTKKFNTGIYPYSLMASIYTPVDFSGTLKTTASVQEWCGQSFTQLNATKNQTFSVQQFSYFEGEGDQITELPHALLEDEIWNIIRLDPKALPTGKVEVIPGSFSSRLRHKPLKMEQATLGVKDLEDRMEVEVVWEDRSLVIKFDKAFPHKILGWEETYSEFGGKKMTTKAELIKDLRLPYWKLHNNEHLIYRDSLGIM